MEDLVSIIMPTYNRGYIIQRAIDSVLAQSYKNWELIIVDDGSTDDTEEVVGKNADERIKYIRYMPNKGANHARNCGLNNACGEWLTFLDSDAVYEPDSLKVRMQCLVEHDVDVVWTRTNFIDLDGNQSLFPVEGTDFLNKKEVMIPLSLEKGLINTSTLIINQRCHKDGHKFDEQFPRFQDWDFFLGLILDDRYNYYFSDVITVTNHMQNNSISYNVPFLETYVKLIEKHIDNFRKYNVVPKAMDVILSFAIGTPKYKSLLELLEKLKLEELKILVDKSMEMNINLSNSLQQKRIEQKKMDWRLPLGKIPVNARVIIYGAGEMGTSFVRQIADTHYCNVVLWVDKNYEKMGKAIQAPKMILECNYDYVLVSILNEEIVRDVVAYLVELGVERRKIIIP